MSCELQKNTHSNIAVSSKDFMIWFGLRPRQVVF